MGPLDLTTATRLLKADIGHRVYGHESKCANLHGHEYFFEVSCRRKNFPVDSIGRVVDFSVIKDLIGNWIDQHWDHGMLLWKHDPLVGLWEANPLLKTQKFYAMEDNPTAENIAKHLFDVANELFVELDVECVRVVVRETYNCSASYPQ